MTRNPGPPTPDPTSGAGTVRLKKPHPCGGYEFSLLREGVVVTLKCGTCGSIIRMERDRYEKSLKPSPTERVAREPKNG
ncbi:MAG: DUF951 domain-containing protein [bacterium]|nr:MAG: DUF951 domain-containing protein [bacterium]